MIGHQFQARTSDPSPLGGVLDWWLVKLSQRLCFPPEIATANLRPDLLLSSSHFTRFVWWSWIKEPQVYWRNVHRKLAATTLVKDLGKWGQVQHQAKALTSTAEQGSQKIFLWCRRPSKKEPKSPLDDSNDAFNPSVQQTAPQILPGNPSDLCLNPTYTSGAQSIRGGHKTDDLCDSHFCTN